jgi:UDP-glucose 4-epimerase
VRALVTGGAGFIGSNLVDRLLAERHAVDVVDDLSTGSLANLSHARALRGEFHFHQFDVTEEGLATLIERRRPEIVFHLAAQPSVDASLRDPGHDAAVNVIGTVRVLDGARRAGVRKVVFAASGGTLYGALEARELPVDETRPFRPSSPYGVSKKVALDYLAAFRDLYGLEFTALALANVYGPRQDASGECGVVARFAADLLAGRPSTIDGDGQQTRDFVFVDDVVDAFCRAGERGGGLVINVGTGVQTSVGRLYSTMAAQAGSDLAPLHGLARPGDLRANALDPGRAQLHLGWVPWTPLEQGVAATLAFAARQTGNRLPR